MNSYANERGVEHWPEWSAAVTSVGRIPPESERAILYRERNSHKGISSRSALRKLVAHQVNQSFLEEIGELSALEYLEIEVLTAEDLRPLSRLKLLERISIHGIRKSIDFGQVLAAPSLRSVFIANAKHLKSLDFLEDANHLQSIGVEGGMWSTQTIESLRPLAGLRQLEALFMTSVRLKDKNLAYLAACPRLRILECARFAPKAEFVQLRKLMPHLECNWCDQYEIRL